MKLITEMTDAEVLDLTDEQLEAMCKYRFAEEGIKILDCPEEPEYKPEPDKDITLYEIEGVSIPFITRESAEKVSNLMQTLARDMREKNYGDNYKHKILGSYKNYDGTITPVKIYSESVYKGITEILRENEQLKERYNKAKEEYDKESRKGGNIRDEIYGYFYEVRDKYRNFDDMNNHFQQYVMIANEESETDPTESTKEVAMKFLNKAYGVGSECENYIRKANGMRLLPQEAPEEQVAEVDED